MKKSIRTRVNALALAASMVLLISSHTANAQNVGIGTPTPAEKLDVAGSARVQGWDAVYKSLDNVSGKTFHLIGTYHGWNSEAVYIAGYNYYNPSGGNPDNSYAKWVHIGRPERMTVDLGTGNVGIGTTAPAQKLHVVGVVRVSSLAANALVRSNTNGDLSTINLTGSPNDVLLGNGTFGNITSTGAVTGTGVATRVAFWNSTTSLSSDANLYWDNTNKRLGIGTATPWGKLHVQGASSAEDLQVFIGIPNAGTATAGRASVNIYAPWGGSLVLVAQGGAATPFHGVPANTAGISSPWRDLVFATAGDGTGAERMRITTAGNVGIGTATPGVRLDVVGTNNVIRSSVYGSGGAILQGIIDVDNGYSRAVFAHNARWNATTNQWIVDAIGANDASAIFIPNGGGFEFILHPSTGNTSRTFTHSNFIAGSKVTIRNNGNVGIGTTTPSEKLEIKGNVMLNNGSSEGARLIWRGGPGGTKEYRARVSPNGNLAFFPIELGNPGYVGEVLTLTQSGNVGISQLAPITKLHVAGLHPGAGGGNGSNSDAPSQAIITNGADGGSRYNDWPNGWGGGISTWDICGSAAYLSLYATRSDKRFKQNIHSLSETKNDVINKFMQLRPVSYFINPKTLPVDDPERKRFGFIANEVETIFPNLVINAGLPDSIARGLEYDGFIPILVMMTQEQQKIINELNTKNQDLVKSIEELKAELDKLTTVNEQLTIQNVELKSRLERVEQMLGTMAAENK